MPVDKETTTDAPTERCSCCNAQSKFLSRVGKMCDDCLEEFDLGWRARERLE